MGVPILRGGRVRGVLVIQHKDKRVYFEEEVETLQTIAMVVAELTAGGELVSQQEISSVADAALLPTRLDGVSLNRGLAMGLAVLHRPSCGSRVSRLRRAALGVLPLITACFRGPASTAAACTVACADQRSPRLPRQGVAFTRR